MSLDRKHKSVWNTEDKLAHCIEALRHIVELDPGLWKTQKAIAKTCLMDIGETDGEHL